MTFYQEPPMVILSHKYKWDYLICNDALFPLCSGWIPIAQQGMSILRSRLNGHWLSNLRSVLLTPLLVIIYIHSQVYLKWHDWMQGLETSGFSYFEDADWLETLGVYVCAINIENILRWCHDDVHIVFLADEHDGHRVSACVSMLFNLYAWVGGFNWTM